MKKKQRCFFKRFAALVAALCLSCSLMLPFASAASDTESDMPSLADFQSHYGSWFVWREVSSPFHAYELSCSPIYFDASGAVSPDSYSSGYTPTLFDVNVLSGSSTHGYACAYPVPFYGASGKWSELPSFPVGCGTAPTHAVVRLYSTSSWLPSSNYAFLSPVTPSSDRLVDFSTSSGSESDSFVSASFPSPFYSYPFAFRVYSSTNQRSYEIQGGDDKAVMYSSSQNRYLYFRGTRFLAGTSSFVPPPYSYLCPSSDLGLVLISSSNYGSGTLISSASQFAFSDNVYLVASLLVPVAMLPDVKVGDWISDSPEDLQDSLTNEFGVDSGKLKDSKNSITDWSNTSSIDSDVASGASGLLNGLFQNLGTFLFSVSLLCFGAVVLRMLVKKAVS